MNVFNALMIGAAGYFFSVAPSLAGVEVTPLARAENELALIRRLPPSQSRTANEARLLFWKAKYTEDKNTKLEILDSGLTLVETLKQEKWTDPVALMAWIALKGEQVQLKNKLVALTYLRPLEQAALELKQLDPSVFEYAADRILGRLYHMAPSFISIGSRKKAREHLENAIAGAPDYPENQLFYAEFLWARAEKKKAISLLKKALSSPLLEKYPLERTVWEEQGKLWLAEWEAET